MLPHLQKNGFGSHSKGLSVKSNDTVGSPNEEIKFTVPTNKLDKPKRNRSAFIIFSSEMRTKMEAEEKKKINSNEMMVKLADLWKNLKDEERRRYCDMADKEKVKYLVELNEFYQTHPYEVIQNKTKKNHVKKPCSAYGLFLKETKQTVKAEHPELKMADILKIVAEKWKKLSEGQRKIYQDQAKIEKEANKAKANEQANHLEEEQNALVCLPQKRLQSQKRVKKALIRENMKQQAHSLEDQKTEEGDSDCSPFEEAVFVTEKEHQRNESIQSFSDINNDLNIANLPLLTFNSGRTLSIEPIFYNSNDTKETNSTKPSSSLEDVSEMKSKKSGDLLMDLLNFHSQQKTFETSNCSQPPLIGRNSSNYLNFITTSTESSRQVLNDSLMKALSFEPSNEFDFDFLQFDTTVNGASF